MTLKKKARNPKRIVKAVTNSMKVNDDDSLIVAIYQRTYAGECSRALNRYRQVLSDFALPQGANNLHQAFVRCPVVMFFLGTYNEQELILF